MSAIESGVVRVNLDNLIGPLDLHAPPIPPGFNTQIKPGFTAEDPPQPVQRRQVRLEDPMNGDVTVLEDKIHIAKLLEVAKRSRASEAWGMSRVLRLGEGGTVITAAEPGRADDAKGD